MSIRRATASGQNSFASRPSSGKGDSHSGDALVRSKRTSGSSVHKSTSSDDESIVVECRAAYISVVQGSSAENPLTSKSDLLLALQNTGRNPTQRNLSKFWTTSTDNVTFEEFCEICKREPVTSADDLMKAFKKIDLNGDGFISHSELKKIMTTKGEKMSDEEVSRLIDEVDENKDGKLDYKEFSNMVLNTSKECKEKAVKRFEKRKAPIETYQTENRSKDSSKSFLNGASENGVNGSRHKEPDSPLREHNSTQREHNSTQREHNSTQREHNSTQREHNSTHREQKVMASPSHSARERRISSSDKVDSKRTVPRSPRMSPRLSKGAKSKDESQKDKYGSQTSLRSVDSRQDELPKPAPRRMSRQESVKPPPSSLNLKLQTPKKLNEWRQLKRRGIFYLEENGEVSSSQYSLVITQSTSVWVTISPAPYQSTATPATPVDMCIFIVRNKPDKNGNTLICFTAKRDNTGNFGVRCDLEPGKYTLLTFTSGCGFPLSKSSSEPQKKLVRKKTSSGGDDQFTLTKEFKYILTDIFNMVDTDMNGLLSREEFSMYSLRTGEDEVGNDEWEIVKENAELKQGELSCKGFIQLIELEAEDAAGDTDDLWLALEALGYDSSLVQNQAYPFTMEISLENDPDAKLSILSSLITSKSRPLQLAVKEAYISKGETLSSDSRCRSAKSSGNDRDVRIYCYENETMAALLIENKLPGRVSVKLDCTGSKNVKSNKDSLADIFAVPSNTAMAVCHLVPKDESKEWFVSCIEKDLVVLT